MCCKATRASLLGSRVSPAKAGYTIGGARQRLTSEDGPNPVAVMSAVSDSLKDLQAAKSLLQLDD